MDLVGNIPGHKKAGKTEKRWMDNIKDQTGSNRTAECVVREREICRWSAIVSSLRMKTGESKTKKKNTSRCR